MTRPAALTLALLASCAAPSSGAPGAAAVSAGAPLSAPRATHAMVRAGDSIVALGGCVADGCEADPASATADVFTADGTRRLRIGRLLRQRVQPAAVALRDGRVLVIGGWSGGTVTATTELFDPRSGRSTPGPTMAGPRAAATVTLLADGRVLIAGGWDRHAARADAELYDPASGRLSPAGRLATARSGATGTLLRDGRVLIVGGGTSETAGRQVIARAELFDSAARRFSPTGALLTARYKHGAVRLPDGDVLVIGGADVRDYGGKLASVERYDVASGRFRPAGRLSAARFKLADGVLAVGGGRVLVAAGSERPELFDAASGRGTPLDGSLGGQWNYLTAVRAGPNRAFLAGGYREGRIEPTARTWLVRL